MTTRPLPSLRWLLMITSVGLLIGSLTARSLHGAPETDHRLSLEDLIEARERGDISDDEFEEFAGLLEQAAVLDREVRNAVTLIPDPGVAGAWTRQLVRMKLRYSSLSALRGTVYPRRLLQGHASAGPISLRMSADRGASADWRMRDAGVSLRAGHWLVDAGAIDVRWTGGLLIGRAPQFIDGGGGIWRGMLQPHYARLTGVRLGWQAGRGGLQIIVSQRGDSRFRHNVQGVQLNLRPHHILIQPAVIRQSLESSESRSQFESWTGGLHIAAGTSRRGWEVDAATGAGGRAWQASLRDNGTHLGWRARLWQISPAFRHPLLHARTQSDREYVYYPELDVRLSSASTGESGVEVYVRAGSTRRFAAGWLRTWRETPLRRAALRTGVDTRNTMLGLDWRWSGLYYTRPLEDIRLQRVESRLSIERGPHRLTALVRHSDGHWAPFSDWSGSVRAQWDVDRARFSRLALSAMLSSYDLNTPDRWFWTIRVDQQLHVSALATIGMHVRWRSSYNDNDASLTLRVDSTLVL